MCEIENGSREKLEKMWGAFAEVLTNDEYVKLKKECVDIFELTSNVEELDGFRGELRLTALVAKKLGLYVKLYSIMNQYK